MFLLAKFLNCKVRKKVQHVRLNYCGADVLSGSTRVNVLSYIPPLFMCVSTGKSVGNPSSWCAEEPHSAVEGASGSQPQSGPHRVAPDC